MGALTQDYSGHGRGEAGGTFTDAELVAIFNVASADGRGFSGQRVILGYANVREEMREHRAAYALRHVLDWLSEKGMQGRFRQELLAMATVLAKLVMNHRAPGAEEVAQWTSCRRGTGKVSSASDWSLETARCVEGLLREGVVDQRLVLDPEMASLWTRSGFIAASLWHWQPFGEYAESMDGAQVVPDCFTEALLARQAVQSVVACSTQAELKTSLVRQFLPVASGRTPGIADTLCHAVRLIDNGWALAER